MRQQLYLAALLNQAPPNVKNAILTKAQISDIAPFEAAINNTRNCIAGNQARANETSEKGLVSAFCNIVKGENHYYKAAPLSLNKDFFPATNIVTSEADKTNLWSSFLDEINALSCDPSNLTPFTETLLHLLHKYTVSLPNPTNYLPDVSFYDHAKMTAAMAICFDQTDNTNEPFLLVKADMSGIQAYIYDIVSKGAAKNLKGRSFYVQLLSDAVLRYLLKEFDLPQANIVFNSGGNFLLLVPNTAGNKTKVDNLEKEIAENLFTAHKTAIAIIIDYVEIVAKDLVNGTKCITKILADKIDEKKKRKFANHIKNNYSSLFDAQDVKTQDKITGEDIEDGEEKRMLQFEYDVLFQPKDGKPAKDSKSADFAYTDLKLLTFKQICLGRRLKKADYLVVTNQSLNFNNNEEPKYQINPANLGVYYYLAEDKNDLENVKKTNTDVALQIYSFNELNFIPTKPNTKHQYGFMLYGGNEAPTFEYNYKDSDDKDQKYHAGEIKTFSHLTLRLSDSKTNGASNLADIKRLGVMLLDVDGLGTVFKEKNFDSLAQYAAFSRHLDYFFLGYINTLWRGNEQFKQHIQVIYAGGDDVFIVGRWDLIIDFAELLQTQLLAWSCQTSMAQQPKVSLSGGIATVTHKFPIMKAAAMADKAEKKAKRYEIDYLGKKIPKNAITLWNTPLNWYLEYPIVKQLEEMITYCIDNVNGCKGVFMNLQEYYYQHFLLEEEGFEKEKREQSTTPSKQANEKRYVWKYSYHIRWRIAYYIARTQDRYHRDDNFCKLLETLKQGVFCNSYRSNPLQGKHHFFTLLNLAIRWAELNHRTNHKK